MEITVNGAVEQWAGAIVACTFCGCFGALLAMDFVDFGFRQLGRLCRRLGRKWGR